MNGVLPFLQDWWRPALEIVILAVGIAVLATVGQWANARWLRLNTQLANSP